MNKQLARIISGLIPSQELRHQVRDILLSQQMNETTEISAEQPTAPKTEFSILTDRLELFDTVTGKYYLPADAHGDIIANAIKNNTVFDGPIYAHSKNFIVPGTTVLDVGSNFGQMALMLSLHVGDGGMVHAFEADPFIFDILSKNIEINAAKIIPHYGAVHSASGETLYFPEQDFKRFQTFGSYGIDYVQGKGRPIPTITIDDFEYEKPVSFMKIDVQGGDLFAMRGALKTIEKYRMPILFEYEYLFELEQHLSFQEYIDFVKDIGYVFHRVIMGQNYLILPKEAPQFMVDMAYHE